MIVVSEDFKRELADARYLEHGKFIYFRAARVDGRSGIYSLSELEKAIQYIESRRHLTAKSTPEEIQEYNVWTAVLNYLEFIRCKLPVDESK